MAAPQAVSRLGLAALAQRTSVLSVIPVQVGLGAEIPQPTPEDAPKTTLQHYGQPEHKLPLQAHIKKTFSLHIGADLKIPTQNARHVIAADAEAANSMQQPITSRREAVTDPFEGLPLRRFADRLGEHIFPAFQAMQEDMKRAKSMAKQEVAAPVVEASSIPSFLPFTRWAVKTKRVQNTLIAEEGKDRKKARLSWYHPDDTMVPRDWFRGGLLADLKYYQPFAATK
ncbi:hypothetical protein WJX72_004602 [[Myrmecia] bisecta]|uniref:Uncharacterized protein n=1 Tax=[Myrmecia] bisecta TaxID=41462 RepID=A0AAW1QAF0_9CHLO